MPKKKATVSVEKDLSKCRGFIDVPIKKTENKKVKRFLEKMKVTHTSHPDESQKTVRFEGVHPDFEEIADGKAAKDYSHNV